MRYAHGKVLLRFARLQLAIAISRNPTAAMNVTEKNIHRSVGYLKLRNFAAHLSPKKRQRFIDDLERQCDGIEQVIKQAKATGEELSLADIEIIVRDKDTGITLANNPETQEQPE